MSITETGIQEQKDFINTWPFERLEKMTLEEYTNLDRESSFCYWIEKKTENTGSIWGGSSYKFGIYRRADMETKVTDQHRKTDGEYAWFTKYGKTKEEAFNVVKSIILKIAEASIEKNFEDIDNLDFGEALKWKIAFHFNTKNLIPIFKKEVLARAASSKGMYNAFKIETSSLQNFLMEQKSVEVSTLTYASEIWSQFNIENFYFVIEKFLKQAQTDNLKKQGFPKTYKGLDVKISFGAGNTARIPWIALLKPPNVVTDGIYPVYLYYKEINTLILAYGLSETNKSTYIWNDANGSQTITEWYLQNHKKKPDRYGTSYVKAVYDLSNDLDSEASKKDLEEIVSSYLLIKFNEVSDIEFKEKEKEIKRYWIVAPGEGANKWEEFYKEEEIGLGWDEIDDLSKFEDREDIRGELQKHYPKGSKSQTNNSLALWEFSKVMRPGDILIPKKGTNEYLGYGVVESDYIFKPNEEDYYHRRKVNWKKRGVWPEEIHPIVLKTLTDVTRYKEYVDRLKRLIGIEQKEGIPKQITYWWLNANPKVWKIEDFEIGQEQEYTTHNEKGNKRSRYEYFQAAKPGDLIVGYQTTPIKKAIAIFEVTKGLHIDEDDGEEKISFIIQKFLPNPITWEEMKNISELEQCEVLKNNQGSLFKLSKSEYDLLINFKLESQNEIYTPVEALKELFIDEDYLEKILVSLAYKKNVILQGPPGTGKTFFAKRLAYLMMEEKDESKIEMIQFHQSYSYEDFIQGYRPKEDGTFNLENGLFYRFCKKAQADPDMKYFFIIDEINRGNLSKIFGELMLLIEADKRGSKYAVSLTYSQSSELKFYIPENVYLIGTMNTADRSLALVDYALRRRFAFINVMPNYNEKFQNELINNGVDEGIVEKILQKMQIINKKISDDSNLGSGFQVGHSYFCNFSNSSGDEDWYQFIIDHELGPLLREYWFDNTELADNQIEFLKQ